VIVFYIAAALSVAFVLYRFVRAELWLRRRLSRPGPDLSRERRECLRKVASAIKRTRTQ